MSFLDLLFGVIAHDTKVTRLSAMIYNTEIPGELATRYSLEVDVV